MNDGGFYYQPVFYNADATDTILSPQVICENSHGAFLDWAQSGGISSPEGSIRFYSSSGLDSMTIPLQRIDGMYYCIADTLAHDNTPSARHEHQISSVHSEQGVFKLLKPTSKSKQLEAELWAARLGFCGEWQLDAITKVADGLPTNLHPHPFRFIDHKEQASIRKQPASNSAERADRAGARFFCDLV